MMNEEEAYTDQLNEIRSQLHQIKVLILILILLCLLGFYGVSRAMWDDVSIAVTRACEVLLAVAVLAVPVVIVVSMRALGSPAGGKPRTGNSDSGA